MKERSALIASIRGEIMGPGQPVNEPSIIKFQGKEYTDPETRRRGPAAWSLSDTAPGQEVLYFDREAPHRKYGVGLLHPKVAADQPSAAPGEAAANTTDVLGTEHYEDDVVDDTPDTGDSDDDSDSPDVADDFDVSSPDVRQPSTLGISFCVQLADDSRINVVLPAQRKFEWQEDDDKPVPLNGRYQSCARHFTDEKGIPRDAPLWRRLAAVGQDARVEIPARDLMHGKMLQMPVPMPADCPIRLTVKVFPRAMQKRQGQWLLTLVLCNDTPMPAGRDLEREATLFQTYFEVSVAGGELIRYPESQRPFDQLDAEEKSLALLYRESATWGIGHGCSAGWDAGPGQAPGIIYADVMPAVETPSMTPDINDSSGQPIQLSMRTLATLSEDGSGEAWQSLEALVREYEVWIGKGRDKVSGVPDELKSTATRHLDACAECLDRMSAGLDLLRQDQKIRKAFRLANLSMLLQQITAKKLNRRNLVRKGLVVLPDGEFQSPWQIFSDRSEGSTVGRWRAFQIAFLLMSLKGVVSESSPDRETVDLIWFPTGGGKTEAYLGVIAFYMFHERLVAGESGAAGPRRDGTNVLMRYTLRMLTTQQFQRAASLICAMEFLRRNPDFHTLGAIGGKRFSLGLWIGGDGSPNNIAAARTAVSKFRKGDAKGNPLILTECPWCRSEIGRYDGAKPPQMPLSTWNNVRMRGIFDQAAQGPSLHCSEGACPFGSEAWEEWLPVEVIDERIYREPPSMVIATADKFAMIAYRPQAGALFGRTFDGGVPRQASMPPGLIVQDELHLISGPLGTMYALYESAIERLCSYKLADKWVKPKLIASTATIRGADDQVRSLYGRTTTCLFPSPGLVMGDSFFGTYARNADGKPRRGRLYLGLHANNYGSILTTQVRAFSSALFRPYSFDNDKRDAWWSLLVFYNSIRELGGAKTLFDGDIRSRLKFLFNREGFSSDGRRNLRIVEELTSRLSQAEIIEMMDLLTTEYSDTENKAADACLASNIIEVGVDIDRLSLMGVVGQPKTTAQYIQVTGRVGRRWWERPGLILMIYNPGKSRDRSHFEQFHSYHRRLYERVEPTSATPFAPSAIQRAMPGVLIAWARQHSNKGVGNRAAFEAAIDTGYDLLRERCEAVVLDETDRKRSIAELDRVRADLERKWDFNPQQWEEFPPSPEGEYLMLWPGQFATRFQKDRGVVVPSSMRQVDGSGELAITQGYISE